MISAYGDEIKSSSIQNTTFEFFKKIQVCVSISTRYLISRLCVLSFINFLTHKNEL